MLLIIAKIAEKVTMKLNFKWEDDGRYHQYCAYCFSETVDREYENGKTFYICSTCGKRHERSIVIDPSIKWWVADDGEYWHESAGVFIRNIDGKFLFFERTIFPFALTVPSGHVDSGEDALNTAKREVMEEVGLNIVNLKFITTDNIKGDSCRRGSDAHKWHAYLAELQDSPSVDVLDEGKKPVWLSLDEALKKDLTFPVEYIISNYRYELERKSI
jgi:8-oxo-dGTP pyrophosphatase MutT (NUDIX family)